MRFWIKGSWISEGPLYYFQKVAKTYQRKLGKELHKTIPGGGGGGGGGYTANLEASLTSHAHFLWEISLVKLLYNS